jgi:hypothetical protein
MDIGAEHVRITKFDSVGFEAVARGFGVDALTLANTPVDIRKLAYSLQKTTIREIKKVPLPIDGMLTPHGDSVSILINDRRTPQRQRFTCAHELAHAMLEPNVAAYRQLDLTLNRPLERLCDRLASVLLMPNPRFRQEIESRGGSIATIEEMGRMFYTSLQATATRMIGLVDRPTLLIISGRDSQDGDLRVRWTVQSDLIREEFPRWYIPTRSLVQIPSIERAFKANGIIQADERMNLGTSRPRAEVESKGFGNGDNRYVLSVAHLT